MTETVCFKEDALTTVYNRCFLFFFLLFCFVLFCCVFCFVLFFVLFFVCLFVFVLFFVLFCFFLVENHKLVLRLVVLSLFVCLFSFMFSRSIQAINYKNIMFSRVYH